MGLSLRRSARGPSRLPPRTGGTAGTPAGPLSSREWTGRRRSRAATFRLSNARPSTRSRTGRRDLSITSGTRTLVGLEAERLLGELEGGDALLFPSGSGATTALALAMLEPGATVAVADGGYWGTVALLRGELGRWGLEVVSVRPDRLAAQR